MTLSSPAFLAGQAIPKQYTCDGQNVNPPLVFSDVPSNTISLVLVMDDPDVPKNLKPDGVFDHWVLYNIPAGTAGIQENFSNIGQLGKNSSGQAAYTGPCPPNGQHRYFFKLFALDTELQFADNPTKQQVLDAIANHILARAELMGVYDRGK